MHALDTLVISHSDSDHAGSAPAVLDTVAERQLLASLPSGDALWSNARQHDAPTLRYAAGQCWRWDGVEFRMLWPEAGPLTGKPNHQSCVLKVTNAKGRVALFTGDIEADVERTLIAREGEALHADDVLIAPHHGSRTSSTERFLDSVGPLAAVFQVCCRNRFHHPNATVYACYQMRDIALTRSDDGATRIDIGAEIVLERYRETHARYWMGR